MCPDAEPMEIDIKPADVSPFVGTTGKKVLIATLFNPDPVILACVRLGPEKLILLIDKEAGKDQMDAVELIQNSLGKAIEVKTAVVEPYDVVGVAAKAVQIIDSLGKDDEIYANITSGRKTKAIGLLFACYARHKEVKKIAYNPEEDKKAIVWLPRLSFHLTESEKLILEKIDEGKFENIKDLADKLEGKLSSAMVYRSIDALNDMDMVVTEPKLGLTDAGKIARL